MVRGTEQARFLERPTPEALGSKLGDLIAPCRAPYPRHDDPPRPEAGPPFALALSGGGFRATLSAIGVLRFLADAGLLRLVRYVSSVSGGSIANGLFACAYPALAATGLATEAFVERVEEPAVRAVSSHSFTLKLARNLWRAIGPGTRTTVLARGLDDWFFGGRLLHDLPTGCRFVFNAANLPTGVRFGFERDVAGDWVIGNLPTDALRLRVAEAVAASAAVPGFFAPFTPRGEFPCERGRKPRLVDGGVYENTGLEPIDDLSHKDACIVALNAGGVFRTGAFGVIPVVRDLVRSEGLLYRQSTALRMRAMVDRFKQWEEAERTGTAPPPTARRGVLFGLASTVSATSEWLEGRPEHDELTLELALLKTSFARFPLERCRQLVYRGWWLTGATLCLFHRGLLPPQLPEWRPLT